MKNDGNSPRVVFESSFIEEAVFLVSKYNVEKINDAIVQEFHEARESIYQNLANDDRNSAFEKLYKEHFDKLRINELFEKVVVGLPLLHRADVRVFVKKVWSKSQEDTELFMDEELRTVCIALMVNRVLQPFYLQAILRHDLLRISDMLDPVFQYTPHIHLAGKNELENNLIKDRFRILWDVYIDARLRRKGYSVMKSAGDQKSQYEKAFFFLKNNEQEYIYSQLDGCEGLTQGGLMNWAQDARSVKTLGEGGLRCPLCDFTSFDTVRNWPQEARCMAETIEGDYPRWTPEQGICPQCFDLYSDRIKVKV